MNIFITLLRGINVSGQKLIKMSELKILFEDLGFTQVTTYIQSGNVVFKSKKRNLNDIEGEIQRGLKSKFNFDVQVFVITSDELENIISNNPFIKKNKEEAKLYVTFLSKIPDAEKLDVLSKFNFETEEYRVYRRNIFLHFPNGYGKAKLNNNLIEKKLGLFATTRNWNTMINLSEIINKM